MIDVSSISPGLVAAAVGVIGLMVGSFLNVVIYRLPKMLQRDWAAQCREMLEIGEAPADAQAPFNLVLPPSHCPHCTAPVTALQNIPVVSYLLLKGRCGQCGKSISPRYPVVELLTGITFAVVAWQFGATWMTLAALVLTGSLIALAVIDFDHQILPDVITLPLLWLGLIVNLFGLFTDLRSAVIGAVAGYLFLWTVYQVFRLVTGKEGMGFGDFKLLAVFGAWFGWHMLPFIVMASAFVGAVVGISLIVLRGRDRNIPIPFGPYLAAAGWIAMLWGDDIIGAYLQFSGLR